MPASPQAIADRGPLGTTPLPTIVLDLHRRRFTGDLHLSRAKTKKRITFREGAPALSESNVPRETLIAQLADQGALNAPDAARASEYAHKHRCKEGAALLALGLVEPKALLAALKSQLRQRLLECFCWQDGEYRIESGEDPGAEVAPFRLDPLPLVQTGLEAHWPPGRLLEHLAPRMDQYPAAGEAAVSAIRRLKLDAQSQHLLKCLDGQHQLGRALGTAINSPRALAIVWVLDAARLLAFSETANNAATAETEQEIEIEVALSKEERAPEAPVAAQATPTARPKTSGADAGTLRQELLSKHAALDDLDHYAVLGVEQNANATEIKKVYFKLAKVCHPDALARMGLTDIAQQAERVFARAAESFDVLSKEDKRRQYDAALLDDGPEIDVAQLAQAEALYRKGEILVKMGNFKGALEFLEPAVTLWPDESDYQCDYGWALFKQVPPDSRKARVHLEKAIELAPENSVAHLRLGLVLRNLGEDGESAEHLSKAGRDVP